MPDTFLIGRLSCFGSVLSFRRDLLAAGIRIGICMARMRLTKPIPSSITVAGENVFISYPSQPRTCRKCGQEGHMAGSCNQIRCLNCDQAGHRVEECQEPDTCKICCDSSHPTSFCPFFIHSADVEPSSPGNMSYSTAAKTIFHDQKEQKKSKNAADLQKTELTQRKKNEQQEQQLTEQKQKSRSKRIKNKRNKSIRNKNKRNLSIQKWSIKMTNVEKKSAMNVKRMKIVKLLKSGKGDNVKKKFTLQFRFRSVVDHRL